MLHPEKYLAPLRRTHLRWSRYEFESNLTTMRNRWRISSKPSINIIDQVRANHEAGGGA